MLGVIAVWRRPTKAAAYGPLVVILHGRGADEYDLVPVMERLPPTVRAVCLRGLVGAEGGYTWFENHGVARPVAASLRASVATVREWLDANAPISSGVCYLLGFSAGMMLAGALLLGDPARFGGAILLSGAIAFDSGIATPPQRLAGTPVFYAYGTRDDVIPAPLVTRTQHYLQSRSGADLTQRAYDRGHAICVPEIHDIGAWLGERAS